MIFHRTILIFEYLKFPFSMLYKKSYFYVHALINCKKPLYRHDIKQTKFTTDGNCGSLDYCSMWLDSTDFIISLSIQTQIPLINKTQYSQE